MKITTDRKKTALNKHWSVKDRVKACAAWLSSGNMHAVSDATGIPLGTLHTWKMQPWWFEQIERIKAAEDQELDNGFTKIVRKSQEIMLERLEHGDYNQTKDGKLVRVPVKMRDAAIVGAISADKRRDLRAVQPSEAKVGMQERLKNLESQFTRLIKREETTIDVTPTEVDDGEKLQAGSSVGDPSPQTRTSGAQPSPTGND